MKDLLETMLYPHNLFMYALLLACMAYRKKGLWCLLVSFYLLGNTLVANQVRILYSSQINTSVTASSDSHFVLLGCGGSPEHLPACGEARLRHLVRQVNNMPASVTITTRHCQPYLDFLLEKHDQLVVDCFDGGDNTYQEFYRLSQRLSTSQRLQFVSSDYHHWRVSQLIKLHDFNAGVSSVGSQTFRPVNCPYLSCMLTVNLSNFDLYAKLSAEVSSYAVYRLFGGWFNWQDER
ncbi:hypothetical protein [Arsukibacterium sp.]|uniref:hypothetical protein n=1 Tax=Arsukibacterium sp. TaxID=1977258 RepID=UPI002FDAA09B